MTAVLDASGLLLNDYSVLRAQQLQTSMSSPFTYPTPHDSCVRVLYTDWETQKPAEQFVFAHQQILLKSAFFRQQLLATVPGSFPSYSVDLRMVPDAVNNFKALLACMYGSPPSTGIETLMTLAKLLQVPEVEDQLRLLADNAASSVPQSLASLVGSLANPAVSTATASATPATPTDLQTQLSTLYAQYLVQNQFTLMPSSTTLALALSALSSPTNLEFPASNGTSSNLGDRSPSSSTLTNPPVLTPTSPESESNDQLIVSNDKEGWCRNKKYIENVPNGYRCTVCRKVYGRYNSVSYHVTIYHRNPPIRCGVESCPFTTREARYIHFHKYYRHGIKLPDSIDLASRKCPYCRHISKSPAMLEKHICRHVQDCLKNGNTYSCLKCNFDSVDQKVMFEHLRQHQREAVEQEIQASKSTEESAPQTPLNDHRIQCSLCTFKAEDGTSLQQHVFLQHATEMLAASSNMQSTPLMLLAYQQLMLSANQTDTQSSTNASLPSQPRPRPDDVDVESTGGDDDEDDDVVSEATTARDRGASISSGSTTA